MSPFWDPLDFVGGGFGLEVRRRRGTYFSKCRDSMVEVVRKDLSGRKGKLKELTYLTHM